MARWRPSVQVLRRHPAVVLGARGDLHAVQPAAAMQIRTAGNSDGWKSPPAPASEGFLASESCWIQMWVELPDAGAVAAYQSFLDSYVREEKKAGRFQRPLDNRVTPLRAWLAEQKVVPSQATALFIVSLLFLGVCALNLMGLLLGKFLARAPEIGVRRALGARRRDIFVQHLLECELVALTGGAHGPAAVDRRAADHERLDQGGLRPQRSLRGRSDHGGVRGGGGSWWRGCWRASTRPTASAGCPLPCTSSCNRRPAMELGPILRAMSRNKGRFGLIVLEIAVLTAGGDRVVYGNRLARDLLGLGRRLEGRRLARDPGRGAAGAGRSAGRLGRRPVHGAGGDGRRDLPGGSTHLPDQRPDPHTVHPRAPHPRAAPPRGPGLQARDPGHQPRAQQLVRAHPIARALGRAGDGAARARPPPGRDSSPPSPSG